MSELDPNEPNVHFSQVHCSLEPQLFFNNAFGILKTLSTPYDINEKIYYNNYLCFDKRKGLIVSRYKYEERSDAGEMIAKSIELFAGPHGVSQTPEPSLGRFNDLIMGDIQSRSFWIYDNKLRQFYLLDFVERTVKKGIQLEKSNTRELVAIEIINSWPYYSGSVGWISSVKWIEKYKWEYKEITVMGESNEKWYCFSQDMIKTYAPAQPYVSVLDKTGQIYIYDSNEESLKPAGYLPRPPSLFMSNEPQSQPKELLVYKALPVYAILRTPPDFNKPPERVEVKYLGMNVSSVSREGTAMTLAVFDPNGKQIYRVNTNINGIPSAQAIYTQPPGSSLLTAIEYGIESLQPPLFELASYLCDDIIKPSAGYRSLFILPNSFMGMLGRAMPQRFVEKQILALLWMCPSLILSVWLSNKIRKDAKLTGLSSMAVKAWMAGTIAFGLPAYITYRLTRYKEVMITCRNCGKLRRPDMDTCHHCGSKWDLPELVAPNWRICD